MCYFPLLKPFFSALTLDKMSKAEESCWLSEALLTFCMGLGEVGSLCCCSCFHYVELVWDFEHQRGFGLLSF